jgi:hypothetical protein
VEERSPTNDRRAAGKASAPRGVHRLVAMAATVPFAGLMITLVAGAFTYAIVSGTPEGVLGGSRRRCDDPWVVDWCPSRR